MTTYQVGGLGGWTLGSSPANCTATNTNDLPFVLRQFPWGDYFSRDAGWLPAVSRGVARTLSRLRWRQRALERNVDPRTAEELLDEHEAELGLSDGSSLSLAARRLRVLAKRRANVPAEDESLVNLAYYERLAQGLGYADVVVSDAGDPFLCTDPCDEALMGGGWLLTFIVTATSLGEELDAVLKEIITAEKLAGFYVIYELT